MNLRTMTLQDIPAGQRIRQIAGWNQTDADWHRFLSASPEGCFVAEESGQVCGTVATIGYQNRFAWVGMVLVDPAFRGRGIGTALLDRAIAYLDSVGIPSIKLDATPQGKPLYEKLGFVTEYEIARWTLRRPPVQSIRQSTPLPSLSPGELQTILDLDQQIFGANRGPLLRSVHLSAPQFTVFESASGTINAYAFGRSGAFADHLGPVMATNAGAAQRILGHFFVRSSRETIVTDALGRGNFAPALLQSYGFEYSRPLTRMYRGSNDHPGHPERLCAILGPEFG
jgi:GNAT superfamily N-acetyltransferase